jgi:hypothetical protein
MPSYPSLQQGLPSSYDLRPQLTPVKNQGSCGSCWAFATVGVLEGLLKMRSGATTDLSEQFLVSCNRDNWSCDGGWFAHDYHKDKLAQLQSDPGAVVEADMPYTATNGTCVPISSHPYSVSAWSYVNPNVPIPSVEEIKQAILNHGPVAAGVCAGDAFTIEEASLIRMKVQPAPILPILTTPSFWSAGMTASRSGFLETPGALAGVKMAICVSVGVFPA